MALDTFTIVAIVIGIVFGAVFITLICLSVFTCLIYRRRMTALSNQCAEVTSMTEETRKKLSCVTGVVNTADNESMFSDNGSANASFVSGGSRL
ncbi:hypothetical protein ABB37_05597 [Leptomonas pyrrhocoris]|uniref:Uncharacterized protein n=1 Tax=Leptomonas pyrrhocoris TaxID=157538 RepID=A0A0M9FZF4_LEPPY|nr:hypothetical protein ABB37_05597 [Leptomonas pyrrhocoris]KPA79067.1 hypothetical protein ABB37_05597 [Leptomonas pyrrhocoris]|eukprot:XP_015657506.1 hypothetical protein ABB37_05597 [Leptomonas pyrrhocoris]